MNTATAVLISGQTRTFKHCYPTQKWQVYRKLVNPHFFVSVTPDEQAKDLAPLINDYPGRVWVEQIEQPELDPADRVRFINASAHASWGISVPVSAIYRQLWHLARVWAFFSAMEEKPDCSEFAFTHFVRIRPDLHFHNFTPPPMVMRSLRDEHVHVPRWGSWGGIPDRFAVIQGQTAASHYFNAFHRINEMLKEGCPFHPETMLGYALERAAVPVHQTMDAEFTTIRMPGDKRPHDAPSYSNRDVFRFVTELFREAGL